jgi:antitoxin YobK
MNTKLRELIQTSSHVNFGTSAQAPTLFWIEKTETILCTRLPDSFKWFLNNYGGGEVRGDEIFSIYQSELATTSGGDIAYQYTVNLRHHSIQKTEIPVCATDFGELFVMDSSEPAKDGEFPIYRKTGSIRDFYASDFAGFLIRFIQES